MTDLRQHAGPVFPVIRPAEAADFDSILALNARVVVETSPMDRERLGLLDGMADYHRVATVAGRVAGFLLAMRALNGVGDKCDPFALPFRLL